VSVPIAWQFNCSSMKPVNVKWSVQMHRAMFWTAAITIAIVAASTPSGPAAATGTGEAIGMCLGRGTDCTINAKADGGYTICVNNAGGQQCVNCPPLMGSGSEGSCSVAMIKGRGSIRRATVNGVLSRSAR
jgi:hypothetical protein